MIQRCTNPRCRGFGNYGGRGIGVCDEWLESYDQFIADVGPRPSRRYSLDRIDNDGPYCKGNCRWADKFGQARNRRDNRIITCYGISYTLAEWIELSGLARWVITWRIDRLGWPPEKALTEFKREGTPGDDPERMIVL